MKRYRILAFLDFDMRSQDLVRPIEDHWDENVKQLHRQNWSNTTRGLKAEFGDLHFEAKLKNFVDLGPKPFSVIAFHNSFFEQVRTAFVMGAYYPALTGACSLGERILNHLILALRNDYRATAEYKLVYSKSSFDNWLVPIRTLVAWEVLLPKAADGFSELMRLRHRAIHFRPEVDRNARALSLEAITTLQAIVGEQFSGFGPQPWFITAIPGEIYIKKQWEERPFVNRIYLPNGLLVGPRHHVMAIQPQVCIVDPDFGASGPEISDEEFAIQRQKFIKCRE